MSVSDIRKAMLLCGIDCVIARNILGGQHWDDGQFGVLTDDHYLTPCLCTEEHGDVMTWPADIDDAKWNGILATTVDKLAISTGVIAFEDGLPAGLLLLWQEAAPMALFRRASELESVLNQM